MTNRRSFLAMLGAVVAAPIAAFKAKEYISWRPFRTADTFERAHDITALGYAEGKSPVVRLGAYSVQAFDGEVQLYCSDGRGIIARSPRSFKQGDLLSLQVNGSQVTVLHEDIVIFQAGF